MVVAILLGLAAWIATSTIVEAEVFRDVREGCDKVHAKFNNWWTYKLRYLLHCHMCTGIWVSAVIALFVPPLVMSGFVGWGLTALSIKGIAHLFLVVQKLAESITDSQKSNQELNKLYQAQEMQALVPTVEPASPSHIDEIRSAMHREKTNNVGWPTK